MARRSATPEPTAKTPNVTRTTPTERRNHQSPEGAKKQKRGGDAAPLNLSKQKGN